MLSSEPAGATLSAGTTEPFCSAPTSEDLYAICFFICAPQDLCLVALCATKNLFRSSSQKHADAASLLSVGSALS